MTAEVRGTDAAPLILAFPDIDPLGVPCRAILDDLARNVCGAIVRIEQRWMVGDLPELCRTLSDEVKSRRRLICAGIGAGARAALFAGRFLQAEMMLVWAPSGNPRTAGPTAAALYALFGDPAIDRPNQIVHLVTASDTARYDLALVTGLRRRSTGVRMDQIDLPYPTFPQSLRQTGQMAAATQAVVDHRPPPKRHGLADAWRLSFAHDLQVNPARAYGDADGARHILGAFRNCSAAPMDLKRLAEGYVRIGARLYTPDHDLALAGDARAAFTAAWLEPAQSIPFGLIIPPKSAERASEIRIALVCEGRFWFDDMGFPAARLRLSPGLTPRVVPA